VIAEKRLELLEENHEQCEIGWSAIQTRDSMRPGNFFFTSHPSSRKEGREVKEADCLPK
jgi:hypothetical protein